jgi:type I restriction enzyme S subunit
MLSVTITRGLVKQKELLEGSSKKDSSNLDKSAYKLVQPRDIAYNKMRAWQGAIGVSALRGIISPAYVVMRLRNADDLPSYFHYLYRTPQFAKEAERWSYGITSDMWSLRPEHFKMIYTPEPPPDEQAAIVRFLDWANGRLERAIRAKRKVIALLNEQKQAIIHRAVTRGFDPSVPLKRSRVPWLGDVPKHWGIFPIRRLATRGRASIVNGPFGSDLLTTELVRTGVPVVYIRDISSGQYRRRSRWHVSAAKAEDISFCQVLPGDVLIAKVGDPPGTAAVYPEGEPAAVVTQDVIRLRPNRNVILSEYLVRLLNSSAGRTVIAPIRVESTRGRFSLPEFRALAVELPPIDEQARILEEIWSLERPVVAAASRLEREIELLREYRTRLVADVVTGKLDVREAAARLPDDASLEAVEDNAGLGDEIQAADEEAVA